MITYKAHIRKPWTAAPWKILGALVLAFCLEVPAAFAGSTFGYFDTLNGSQAGGWVYQKANKALSITVSVLIDGVVVNDAVPADIYRADVNQVMRCTGNHGFSWTIPVNFNDGKTHTISIYGVDPTTGERTQLMQSPRTFAINAPPPGGYLDGISYNLINGWAYSPALPASPIKVTVTIDGSVVYSDIPTDAFRGDVNQIMHLTNNHGFALPIPDRYFDGKSHQVRAYAQDPFGKPNVELNLSPQSFSIMPPLPVITQQPVSVTVPTGATPKFTVAASGGPVLTYQWMQQLPGAAGFTAIAGATAASFTAPLTTDALNGTRYKCVVSNMSGGVDSAAATMSVSSVIGNIDAVNLNADGTYAIYGWVCSVGINASIPAALYLGGDAAGNGSTYYTSVPANFPSDAGVAAACKASGTNYRFQMPLDKAALTGFGGQPFYIRGISPVGGPNAVIGNPNKFVVPLLAAPAITSNPASVVVKVGTTPNFAVAAQGTPTPGYQWAQQPPGGTSATDVAGATAPSYSPGPVNLSHNGTRFRCKVANSQGALVSADALLTVYAPANGAIDSFQVVNGQQTLKGWACMMGQPAPIPVALYAGKPGAGGVLIGKYTANLASSAAVATSCNSTGTTYGYSIALDDAALNKYQGQALYVVGLTPGDAGNFTLTGSGNFKVPYQGQLERASRNYIRGWACPDAVTKNPGAVYLYATNVANCASTVNMGTTPMCLLTPDPAASLSQDLSVDDNTRLNTNPAPAKLIRESVITSYCNGASNGFQMVTPSALLDGKDHQIYAFTKNTPDTRYLLRGAPLTFNSSVLYQQEPIYDPAWNTLISYVPSISPQTNLPIPLPGGMTVPVGQTRTVPAFVSSQAGQDYNNLQKDRTVAYYWSVPNYPLGVNQPAANLSADISSVTGLSAPASNQLGFIDSAGRVNALQMYGTKIGVAMAMRALLPSGGGMLPGSVIGTRYLVSRAPTPFQNGHSLQVNGYFKRPYTEIPLIAGYPGPTSTAPFANGAVYYYYTGVFYNKNCATSTKECPRIWFEAQIYHDPYTVGSEGGVVTIKDSPQDVFYRDGDQTVVYPSFRIESTHVSNWISPCAGSSNYYVGFSPQPQEEQFCFNMSAAQFQTLLKSVNTSFGLSISTNPADYAINSIAMDIETILPWAMSDARLGMSYRDISMKELAN